MPHSRDGALGKQRMAAHDVNLLDAAGGRNLGLEFKGPTNIHGTRECGVCRRSLNQHFSRIVAGLQGLRLDRDN